MNDINNDSQSSYGAIVEFDFDIFNTITLQDCL